MGMCQYCKIILISIEPVYCSSKAKNFSFASNIVARFLVLVVLKIAIWFFSTTNTKTYINKLFLKKIIEKWEND